MFGIRPAILDSRKPCTFPYQIQIGHSFCRITFFIIPHTCFCIIEIKFRQTNHRPRKFVIIFLTTFGCCLSGMYRFFIQIPGLRIVIRTVIIESAVFILQESGKPLLPSCTFGIKTGCICIFFLLSQTFKISILKSYPCIKTRFAVEVHTQSLFTSFCKFHPFRYGYNVEPVGVIKFGIFINRQTVLGVETVNHGHRRCYSVPSASFQPGNRFTLDT